MLLCCLLYFSAPRFHCLLPSAPSAVSKRPVYPLAGRSPVNNNNEPAGRPLVQPSERLLFVLTMRVTTLNGRKILLKCDVVQRLFGSGP